MQRIVLYFLIAAITLLPLAGHAMSLTAPEMQTSTMTQAAPDTMNADMKQPHSASANAHSCGPESGNNTEAATDAVTGAETAHNCAMQSDCDKGGCACKHLCQSPVFIAEYPQINSPVTIQHASLRFSAQPFSGQLNTPFRPPIA